jgi:phosphate-selective porin OprO/OprP
VALSPDGLLVAVPELSGHFFIGRTKEGYSLIKIMVGYDGWTIERSTSLDAFVPILADGVKYMGYSPRTRLLWNVGLFGDALSNGSRSRPITTWWSGVSHGFRFSRTRKGRSFTSP